MIPRYSPRYTYTIEKISFAHYFISHHLNERYIGYDAAFTRAGAERKGDKWIEHSKKADRLSVSFSAVIKDYIID